MIIVALRASGELLAAAQRVLPRSAELVCVSNVAELAGALPPSRGALTIAPLPAAEDVDLLSQLEALRGAYPWVPLVVVATPPAPAALDVAAQVGRMGAILVDTREPGWQERLQQAALAAQRETLDRAAWHEAGLRLSNEAETLFKVALRLAHEPCTVPQFAEASGMPERTLRTYCKREGLPSPQWIIGWARVLLAAYLLGRSGAILHDVAQQMGFLTPGDLRAMMRRYGCTMTRPRESHSHLSIVVSMIQEYFEHVR